MCICQWWHDKHNKSVDVKFIPESTCMDSRYTDTRIYIIYIFILESITNSFPSFFPSPTPHNIRPKFRCGASAITWFGSWSTDPGSKQTSGTYPKRPSTSQPLFFLPMNSSTLKMFILHFVWGFVSIFFVVFLRGLFGWNLQQKKAGTTCRWIFQPRCVRRLLPSPVPRTSQVSRENMGRTAESYGNVAICICEKNKHSELCNKGGWCFMFHMLKDMFNICFMKRSSPSIFFAHLLELRWCCPIVILGTLEFNNVAARHWYHTKRFPLTILSVDLVFSDQDTLQLTKKHGTHLSLPEVNGTSPTTKSAKVADRSVCHVFSKMLQAKRPGQLMFAMAENEGKGQAQKISKFLVSEKKN